MSKTKYPYYRRYPKDFFGDGKVRVMSADARAFYGELLDCIWEYDTQYSIPNNDTLISSLLGIPVKRWLKLRPEIVGSGGALFLTKNNRLLSRKLRSEYSKLSQHSETQRKNVLRRYNGGNTADLPKTYLSDSDSDSNPKKNTPLPPKREKSPPSDDALGLARLLGDLVLFNNPRNRELLPLKREQTVTRWAEDVDKLIRLDSQKPEDIEKVIRWSQADDWWKTNILSGATLRKQWDKLSAKVFGEKKADQDATAQQARRCFYGGGRGGSCRRGLNEICDYCLGNLKATA